jgi:hypothetical protein
MSSMSSVSSANDFTDKDYFVNIARFLEGYCDLKKLSEINKSSNALIKRETNLKDIVYKKRNKYNCDMLKNYLIMRNRNKNDKNVKRIIENYKRRMNADCLPYLEDIITYYFNEKNKINAGLNIQQTSIYISRILYNIILSLSLSLSLKNNYKLKNKNVVIWLSHHI